MSFTVEEEISRFFASLLSDNSPGFWSARNFKILRIDLLVPDLKDLK